MRSRYFVTGTSLLIGSVVVTLAVIVSPAMTGLQQESATNLKRTTSTQYGPLTGADREFVVKVRLAGLWEYPAGKIGLQKGTTEQIKTAGKHLIDGHQQLDAVARDIAPKLGIPLPNKPTQQQQGFVDTMNAKTGKDFDTYYANILRITHGQIFSAIAKIRDTSKNTLVRQLASQANNTVLDHITQMEKTGMVDFESAITQITTTPTQGPEFTTPPKTAPGEPTFVVGTAKASPPNGAASTPDNGGEQPLDPEAVNGAGVGAASGPGGVTTPPAVSTPPPAAR
jgi:predicted outer membrane protein